MHIPSHFLESSLKRLCEHAGNVIGDIQVSAYLFFKRVILIAMTCAVMTTAEAENVTIHPASPTSLESVVARIEIFNCHYDPSIALKIKQVGSTIRVDFSEQKNCAEIIGPQELVFPVIDIKLGQFPPGVFNVDFFQTYDPTKSNNPQVRLWGSAQFTVTDSYASKVGPFPLVDYTDHWWNPQESGMGFSIMQHPSDRIFAAWFVYNQMGQPIWYTLQPGQWLSSTVYTGPIYKTTGTYLGATYDPNQLVINQVGTGTFRFNNYSSATFTYTIEGVDGTKEITRLPF
ncbi:MAG: hypothetical protein DID92_2727744757 [Candidatus Nitrotoga sp. SPKER]|nr:MAG: hypothetical protein DID92_2727744757 [Candidatus Nitrotoga sp. SPKER]